MTPLWLLDVDGVINAVARPVPIGYISVDVPDDRGHTWPITYRPEVVDFIRDMHASGKVEVRWLTTWCDNAKDSLAPALGLPEFVVEGSDDHLNTDNKIWWKTITAQRVVSQESDRPLIWTDDDLSYANRLGEIEWMTRWDGDSCLVCPDTREGLTDAHLDAIREFVEKVSKNNTLASHDAGA